MRTSLLVTLLTLGTALPLAAQEADAAPRNLLAPSAGLMFWTLIIFIVLLIILAKFAFPKIIGAVEARERALEEAIETAKRDREAAAALLEEHRRLVEEARADAQRFIVEGRAAGEKVRDEILDQAHREQQQILERARQEIEAERDRAIAALRREAVDLAVKGASKVIEKNLDDSTNRALVESFLASLTPNGGAR
jgi:F-type H+-transporting ATPase subunit b